MTQQYPPSNIKIDQTNNGITIRKRWLHQKTLYLIFFTTLWDSLVLPHYEQLLAPIFTSSLYEVLFPFFLYKVLFLFFTIVLNYITLAKWFNRTYIVAGNQEIVVNYKPFPVLYLKNKKFYIVDIERLYSKKKIQNANRNPTYQIFLQTRTGIDKKLIFFKERKEALFVEETLETYFQIQDRARVGEIGGPYESSIPDTMKVCKTDSDLTIIQKWSNGKAFNLTIITILVTIFIPFVTIPFLYYMLATWFNRTYILVNEKEIIVRYGPFPWLGLKNKAFHTNTIKTLYPKQWGNKRNIHDGIEDGISQIDVQFDTGEITKLVQFKTFKEAIGVTKVLQHCLKNHFHIQDETKNSEYSDTEIPN
jgi:hypothetical protein